MVGIVADPLGTATAMLAALDAGMVSSVELVEMHLARIEALDGKLNAIPVPTPERALEEAAQADELRASGGKGALLGLPMTLKESTQVAGLPQSAGIESLADHRPSSDGLVARRVFAAGACLLGKTNIPVSLGGLAGRQSRLRSHQQPMGFGAHTGRQHRWRCCGTGSGDDTARDRERHRWIHPSASRLLRRVRPSTVRDRNSPRRRLSNGRS